jgi:phenylacetate-CoA ligase
MSKLRDLVNHIAHVGKMNGTLDTMLRYNPAVRSQVQNLLNRARTASQTELEALQATLISRVLGWASKTRYGQAHSGKPLQDWPILEKSVIREQPNNVLGPALIRVPAMTSGTTGLALRLERSLMSVAAEQAFIDHLVQPWGLNFRDSHVAVLRHENVKDPQDREPPYGVYSHGGKRLTLSTKHLSRQTVSWYLEELRRFRADILWIYSVAGDLLAALALERDFKLAIPVVMNASEELTLPARKRLEQAFGSQVINYYGQGERMTLSADMDGTGFQFFPLYGKVELIPVGTKSTRLEAGMARAEVIGTGFWNAAQPFVRYRTGDQILYPASWGSTELREVELGYRKFSRVAGRPPESVVTPRGELLLNLDEIHPEVPHVVQMQVVQESPYRLRLCLIVTPQFNDENRAQLHHNARMEIPPEMEYSLEIVETLERSPSGKTPFIVRRFKTTLEVEDESQLRAEPV